MRTGFVLLLIVFSSLHLLFAFNATYLDPTIYKPWEFDRVSIPDFVTTVLLYNPGKVDIDNSYMFAVSPAISSEISEEIAHAKNADENLRKVGEGKYLIIKTVQDYAEETREKSTRAIISWLIPLIGTFILVDTATGMVYETSELGAELLSICKNYYTAAATAVQESELAYNGLLSKVSADYRELWLMGALNPSYNGRYANDIAQLESRLTSIDGGLLRSREANIKTYALVTDKDPSAYRLFISESVSQVKYLLDGQESAFSKLIFAYTVQKTIREGLLAERASARSAAESKIREVSTEYSRVDKEYGQITDADVVYFGISSLETLYSPSIHISKASETIAESKTIFSDGDNIYAAKAYGYVTESTNAYYKASSKVDAAAYNLKEAERLGKFILSSAENITQKEYVAATEAVAAFIPKTVAEQQQLSLARSKISEAERLMNLKTSTATERISNLKLALNNLRLARAYLSPDAVFRANAKDSASKSLEYLKSVIDRAKIDAVDVKYEEDYYNAKLLALQSGNLAPQELVNISLTCTNLTEQIFTRGAAQYSHLSVRYKSLLPVLAYLESLEGSLKEHTTLNSYLGSTGSFDKYLSLGHYKEIAGIIAGLELKVNVKAKEIIRESLEMNAQIDTNYKNATILLDAPQTRYISVSTYSTLDLGYSNPISITIPFKYNIQKSVATYDKSTLSYLYTDGKLNILIQKYSPNKLYVISFEDSYVLVRTLSVKQDVTLITPQLLKATIERRISSAGAPSLKVPTYYPYSYTLYYDGEYIGNFNYDAEINKEISAGEHTLKIIYLIENPFAISVTKTSGTKTTTSISITAKNKAPFDVDTPQIVYDIPVAFPSTVSVSSPDCEVSSTARTHLPTLTRLTITLKSFPAGSTCSFDIYASAPISKEAIEEEIERISKDKDASLSKEVKTYIDKARRALEAGKYEEALKAVSDADNALKEAKEAAAQENRQQAEVERLSREVSSVIANLTNVRDADVQKALSKIKSYYDAASVESDSSKKLSSLKKAHDEVVALDTLVYSKLSSISERLNNAKQKWLSLVDKGYVNSLPSNITEVESLVSKVYASPSPTAETFSHLEKAHNLLSLLENSAKNAEKGLSDWESSLKERFKSSVTALKMAIAQFTKACGTNCPPEVISYSQSLLSLNPQTPSEYALSIDKINKTLVGINAYIATERAAANAAIGELKSALSSISDPRVKDTVASKIREIEAMYVAGEYSRAKEAALAVKASISSPSTPSNDYTLILVGLAVIVISFIVLKMREQGLGKQEKSVQVRELKREK